MAWRDVPTVRWHRYNFNARIESTSLTHIKNPEADGMTLCGRAIPEEGNGVVYCDWYEKPCCRRCEKAWAKLEEVSDR